LNIISSNRYFNIYFSYIILGPKPEKTDGYNEDGILLPVSRLLNNEETAPSHDYDDLEKDTSNPGKDIRKPGSETLV